MPTKQGRVNINPNYVLLTVTFKLSSRWLAFYTTRHHWNALTC